MFSRSLGVVISLCCALLIVGCAIDPDGTGGGRSGIDGECPDPDDPSVHYMNDDQCDDLPPFPCGDEEALFNDECGCGCIALELPPPTGLGDELTEVGGCADMHVYASNPGDTVALFFQIDGVVAAAHEAGGALTTELVLSDDPISLEVHLGEGLTNWACNDALAPGEEPAPHTIYQAVGGSGTLVVAPTGEPTPWGEIPAQATVTLSDVVLESDDGEAVTIDHLELADVFVGWLPG